MRIGHFEHNLDRVLKRLTNRFSLQIPDFELEWANSQEKQISVELSWVAKPVFYSGHITYYS